MRPLHKRFLLPVTLISLLCLLAACQSAPPAGKPVARITPTPTSTPLPTTPDCPADGRARPALLPAGPAGTSAEGITYDKWDQPQKAAKITVSAYNPGTHAQKTILSLSNTWVSETSMLGNWVLLVRSMPDGQSGVQLVRLDGQGLQTLYCSHNYISAFSASPDHHWLAFNYEEQQSNIFNTTMKLLDLTNGAIQTSIQALPLARGVSQFGAVPVEWLDGTHLYVHKSGSSFEGGPGAGLYLLDTTRGPTQRLGDLQLVRDDSSLFPSASFPNADLSPDHSILFTSSTSSQFTYVTSTMGYLKASAPSAITSSSPTGGNQKVVYTNTSLVMSQMRVASSGAILFIGSKAQTDSESLWRIQVNGSGLTQLVHPSQGEYIGFKDGPHNQSSTFSLSGDLYAVQLSSESSSSSTSTSVAFGTSGKISNKREKTQLAIGSVSGGDLTVFAPFSSTGVQFDIVGWGAI